jgi:hypothetical protein
MATSDTIDTTERIATFFGKEFKLSLKVANPEEYDYETNNGLFSITRLKDNKILIRDSIGCMSPDIRFEDYNLDGIKDILVYHFHGARANTAYYLYLANKNTQTFEKIKGFDELPNTEIDENGVIISTALYGMIGYSFYIITKDKKVKQIGKTVEADPADENDLFEKEYYRVLKLLGKKKK